MKKFLKKTFWLSVMVFFGVLLFTLKVLARALNESAARKEYEPTLEEKMCGEKLPFSDEYFIPNQKHKH